MRPIIWIKSTTRKPLITNSCLSRLSSPLHGYSPNVVIVDFIIVRVLPVPLDGSILLLDPVLILQASLLVLLAMNLTIEGIGPAPRLQMIELGHVAYHPRNKALKCLVLSKVPPRQNLLSALRAFLFVLTIIILDTFCAKFMQAVFDIKRSRKHIRTNLAEETLLKAVK